jgi:hypothetical protein
MLLGEVNAPDMVAVSRVYGKFKQRQLQKEIFILFS